MNIYNIIFPLLILIVIGITIYILTRHIPETIEQKISPSREEKKRWWQLILGKGENLLRSFRVIILKIDNNLNNSIKKVRERKDEMGMNLREYRKKHREKMGITSKENQDAIVSELKVADEDNENTELTSQSLDPEQKNLSLNEEESLDNKDPQALSSSNFSRVKSFFKKTSTPKKNRAVEEIVKKNFTPTEIKVETQQYWKRKEEMLIQSIIREPKNIHLYTQLGRLYSNQHNWEDARNAFLEVLKLDKTNVKAKEELKRIEKYIGN